MRQLHEILVGAAVLIIGGGFMVYAFTGGGLFAPSGYEIIARFSQADGLSVGSEVRISGVPVGFVENLTFDPRNRQAVVTMLIDPKVQIPIDSGALIVQVGLLGSKFIKLDPGGEEAMMQPGDQIDFVQDAVIVIDLLKRVVDDVEAKRRGPVADPEPEKES